MVARVVSYEELERLRDELRRERNDDGGSAINPRVNDTANPCANNNTNITNQLLDVITTLMRILTRTGPLSLPQFTLAPPSRNPSSGRMQLIDSPQRAVPSSERERRSSPSLDAIVTQVLPLFSKPMSHPWNNRIAIQIESVSL